MQEVVSGTIQVNTRVNAEDKRRADEVLALMGSSAAELVRSVIKKVSRGARDYDELMSAVAGENKAPADDLLREGWAIASGYYQSLGIDPQNLPADTRSWDEIYESAMDEHYSEKGLMI